MDNIIKNHPNNPDFDDGIERDDNSSLQERISTMLDEKSPHELDRILTDYVDYDAFASSQRSMIIAFNNYLQRKTPADGSYGTFHEWQTFCSSHCSILLTALEKACKD